ncbi:MAG: DUF6655 family protein [Phycisphaerales bacterium]
MPRPAPRPKRPNRPRPLRAAGLPVAILALGIGGCAQTRVTDPARTATEQFLLSKAATDAVAQLSFATLRGRRVWLDNQYFASPEQAFILGELRARMLVSGVQLVRTYEESQVVVEVRSGGVGIDRNDYLFGLPPIQLAGTGGAAGTSGGTAALSNVPLLTPELAAVKNREQLGFAGLAYVAYWKENGEVVASSGPYVGRSLRDDWWFFGVGPRSVGDIPPIEKTPSRASPAAR